MNSKRILLISICVLFLQPMSLWAQSAQVHIGPRHLFAEKSRTPLGKKYADGQIAVFAHSLAGKQVTVDGENWRLLKSPLVTGSYQLTENFLTNSIVAYAGDNMVFDPRLFWRNEYETVTNIEAPATRKTGNFVIAALPGNSNETWRVSQAFRHNGAINLTIKRRVVRSTAWRGQIAWKAVFWESHLLRAAPSNLTSFVHVSRIAGGSEFSQAVQAQPMSSINSETLPVYEADNPKCISLPNHRIVCAMRTSADDDDHANRPLDPAQIFPFSGANLGDLFGVILGSEVVPEVYSPALVSSQYYKGDYADIPPLLIATSDDDGATWTHKFVADRGGINSSFAYDAVSDILVVAYGGLKYPRKGVAIQYSLDRGETWEPPINVSYEEGFTDGTPFIANTGQGRFVLVYSTSEKYFHLPVTIDQWNTYYRIIQIDR